MAVANAGSCVGPQTEIGDCSSSQTTDEGARVDFPRNINWLEWNEKEKANTILNRSEKKKRKKSLSEEREILNRWEEYCY